MKIQDIYRAHHVDRWQIVNVTRTQSLAEHSFNVAMIAYDLHKRLGKAAENINVTVSDILVWALYHDLPEIATGDIASPLKILIKKENPRLIEKVEAAMSPEYSEFKKIYKGTYVEILVKLADLIDGLRYLELYKNPNCRHADQTEVSLLNRIVTMTQKLDEVKFCRIDMWGNTVIFLLSDLRGGPVTSIDTILKEAKNDSPA